MGFANHHEATNDAIRKHRAKSALPAWLASLQKAISPDLGRGDFLDVAETLQLKRTFYDHVKQQGKLLHLEWSADRRLEMLALVRKKSLRVGNMKAVLFSSKDDLLGAVMVPAARVLANADKVWTLVEEDLSLTTKDLKHGFCLEQNYYDEQGAYVKAGTFLLTAWGSLSGELPNQ